jgi:hypothetical protein
LLAFVSFSRSAALPSKVGLPTAYIDDGDLHVFFESSLDDTANRSDQKDDSVGLVFAQHDDPFNSKLSSSTKDT